MLTFIVNPNSRSGHGKILWLGIERELNKRTLPYSVHFTKYQQHAVKLVRQLTDNDKRHTIIVLGGDGTLNEVINGICHFELVTLGYIPTGSSNDFARALCLPTNPTKALEMILNAPSLAQIDIGCAEYQGKSRLFAVSGGIGFDAAICHEAMVSRLKNFFNHIKLGKLTYAAIALHQLFLCNPEKLSLTIDEGPPVIFQNTYFASVMNTRCEGGGFCFCPDALPSDDLLDVIVVHDLPKWKLILTLATAWKGMHTRFKGISIYRGKDIRLTFGSPLALHLDGEPVFSQKDLHFFCHNKKLKVICPTKEN